MENLEASEVPSSSFDAWLVNNSSSTTTSPILIDLSSQSTIRCGKTNIMEDQPSRSFRKIKSSSNNSNNHDDAGTNSNNEEEEKLTKYSEEVKLNISKALEVLQIGNDLESVLIIDSPLDHVEDLRRREVICKILFEEFKISNLSIQDAAYMNLVASGVEFMSGLVIHVGENSSYVVAVVDGQVRMDSLCVGSLSGKHLTEKLKNLLQEHFQKHDSSIFTDEIVNRLKAKYLSATFENFPLYESFNVTDTVTINIGECKEEFKQVSEMLFSNESSSIQQLVKDCIAKINDDYIDLSNNIILSGGTTMMNNFSERLNKELSLHLDEITFNELSTRCPDRSILRYMGANILTSVPDWVIPYCVNGEDYQQDGPLCIVDKKSWDVMYFSPFGDE